MDEEERYNALLRLSNAALDTKRAEVDRLRDACTRRSEARRATWRCTVG